jgi:hypothetical protein
VNRRFTHGKVDRPLRGFADIVLTSSKGLLDPPNKKAADSKGICGFRFANYVRLIFNFYMLNHARVTGSHVVDTDFVFRSQSAFHNVTCFIDDSDRRVERE